MKYLFLILLILSQYSLGHEYADRIIAAKHPLDKFIIADKEMGMLYVIDPKKHTEISTPALFGKLITDNVDIAYYDRENVGAPYITPAGVFTLSNMYSDTLKKDMLVFYEGRYMDMAIHPIWIGNPVQQRVERLNSNNPSWHRITNGCINVSEEFFNKHLKNLDQVRLYVLPETDAVKLYWDKFYPKINNAMIATQ